ncbi:MAG: phage virion morphogenesis protein [Firmicutes bacterium]|nr:phage virion morphogenesis protein [Bacillota bacterium]
MGILLAGDWSRLENSIHRMARLDFTAMHRDIGEHLVSSTKDRFETGTAPDGSRWPESIRAQNEGGQTLRDTSNLYNSITYHARPDLVEVGTNSRIAPVHQEGKIIKVKQARHLHFKVGGRWARKKKVKIPARPFIGISDEDRQAIDDIIAEHLEECLE